MYLYEIVKGLLGVLFISTVTHIYYPKQKNVITQYLLHKSIKGYGVIEKYTIQCCTIIKIKVKNPVIKMFKHRQFDLIFILDGKENGKFIKKILTTVRKPLNPYDFLINIFHIEKDNDIIPYIQVLEIYTKSAINDNYKISNIKFIDIILHNFGKKIKIKCNYDFYICGNILFKPSFVKWVSGIQLLDDNYTITIIDHQASIITLTSTDFVKIGVNSYETFSRAESKDKTT